MLRAARARIGLLQLAVHMVKVKVETTQWHPFLHQFGRGCRKRINFMFPFKRAANLLKFCRVQRYYPSSRRS